MSLRRVRYNHHDMGYKVSIEDDVTETEYFELVQRFLKGQIRKLKTIRDWILECKKCATIFKFRGTKDPRTNFKFIYGFKKNLCDICYEEEFGA